MSIYSKDATMEEVLTTNGLAILDNFLVNCETDESITTGNYILDSEYVIDTENKVTDYIEKEAIVKVQEDYGYEIFRIVKVNSTTRRITVVAQQITISDTLKNYFLDDVKVENKNGLASLQWLLDKSNTDNKPKEISVMSNISDIKTAYYQNTDLYHALYDCDQSFINRWGGETLRRGYTLTINKQIGQDNGVTIIHKKNLKGFEANTNLDSLVTKGRGVGFNGIRGKWIDSPLKNNYAKPYFGEFTYDDVKVRDDNTNENEDTESMYFDTLAQAQVELDRRVALEFSKNDVDKIKASYIISFVQLEQTEEYKNYVQAERVSIGDTIRVYIPELKTDIKVRVIDKKFDILTQKVKELILSNYALQQPMSIQQLVKQVQQMEVTADSNLEKAKEFASALIKSGLKDSCVIVRPNEIIIGNTKDINTMTRCWRFNINGLGYSSTGYYGNFETAITMDGHVVANFMDTGVLSSVLIKNADGSLKIDLSGTGGASFYNDGVKAIEISSNEVQVFDWKNNGVYVGSVGSLSTDTTDKASISMWNDLNSYMSLSYLDTDKIHKLSYIDFDYYNTLGTTRHPITFRTATEFTSDVYLNNVYLNNVYLNNALRGSNKTIILEGDYLWFTPEGGGGANMSIDNNGNVHIAGKITCNALDVMSADKHRVIETSQGKVGINSLETPRVMNEDVGRGQLNENGECLITIESLFKECIETDEYDVFLTKYGKGDIWVQEISLDSFLVCGEPNLKFSWRLIATQKGAKGIRLKKIED
jgi:phage minor structural protein